jgi:predicted nucleic acid-binding protein
MLVVDNNVLSDYLRGREAAREFLEPFERQVWAVPSIVLYKALHGGILGYIDGSQDEIHRVIAESFEVLDVTGETAVVAADIQQTLYEQGRPLDHPDALIVATAYQHDGTFATAEKPIWNDAVSELVEIAEYDPD